MMTDAAAIMILWVILGIILLIIQILVRSAIVGAGSGIIGFVVWNICAGWWLNSGFEFTEIALFFYGVGVVQLVFTLYGSIMLMRGKGVPLRDMA